jgi:hypothetical protein
MVDFTIDLPPLWMTKTYMTNRTPRALDDAEFLVRFRTVVKRLDTQLQLIDNGQYHVRDDLATILRTLLTRGKGDDGIRRLLNRFSLQPPKRDISPPANEEPNILFAIGALPIDGNGIAKTVTVPDQLMIAVPLFVRSSAGTRRATWESVVSDYGNTFGAHLSTTVPAILDDVHYFGLSETDFGTYMLRSLGVLTSSVCHELLHRLDQNNTAVTHPPYMAGTQIYAAMHLREDGKDDLRVNIQREDWKKAGPIMTVRNPEGQQLMFAIADGGQLQFSIRR